MNERHFKAINRLEGLADTSLKTALIEAFKASAISAFHFGDAACEYVMLAEKTEVHELAHKIREMEAEGKTLGEINKARRKLNLMLELERACRDGSN